MSDNKTDDLALVVDDDMQFEPEEPTQRTFTLSGSTIKYPVLVLPFNVANF